MTFDEHKAYLSSIPDHLKGLEAPKDFGKFWREFQPHMELRIREKLSGVITDAFELNMAAQEILADAFAWLTAERDGKPRYTRYRSSGMLHGAPVSRPFFRFLLTHVSYAVGNYWKRENTLSP